MILALCSSLLLLIIVSLSIFQVYNALVLTIVILLYIRSPEFIHLITEILYPFPPPPGPW